jgi:hypothetical protein
MTAKITGGTVSIEETKQITDYSPRKVRVELHFAAEEGRDAEAILDHASAVALKKVAELLAGQAKVTAAVATPPRTKADIEKEVIENLGAKETVTPPKPPRKKVETKTAEADPLGETTTKAPAADPDDLSDLGIDPPKATVAEITDAILMSKITAAAGETKNAVAIRKLVGDYTGNVAGKKAVEIPQDKRGAFIEALKGVENLAPKT